MASIGKAFYKEGNPSGWQGWLGTEEKIKSWIWPFAILGPVGGFGLSAVVYLGFLPASFLGIWILLGLGFLGAVFSALKKAGDEIPSREELKTYRYWMEVLDGQTFQSETLRAAIEPLQVESEKAYKLLAQLDSFGLWVQNRINILYIPAQPSVLDRSAPLFAPNSLEKSIWEAACFLPRFLMFLGSMVFARDFSVRIGYSRRSLVGKKGNFWNSHQPSFAFTGGGNCQ